MHFTYSYSSGSQANRHSNCCTAGALWNESLIMKAFISQRDKFHHWNDPFSWSLQLPETGEQHCHQLTLQKAGSRAHTTSPSTRVTSPESFGWRSSCKSHGSPSETASCFHWGMILLTTIQVVTVFPKVITCPSLQCSCCLLYLPLSPTVSPPVCLCGCLHCHSKSDTNLIQQHLIIISS